jgi:hypothetical protein
LSAFLLSACDDDEPTDPNEPTSLSATLTAAVEVPVCEAAGASATGSATVTISANDGTITVNSLTFSGLSGAATLAHIHFGAIGDMGPIVIDFGANPTSPFTDSFTAADYPSPVPTGAPANFAAFVNAMQAGTTYINVHTAACPSGEIRGQLTVTS